MTKHRGVDRKGEEWTWWFDATGKTCWRATRTVDGKELSAFTYADLAGKITRCRRSKFAGPAVLVRNLNRLFGPDTFSAGRR